MNRDGFTLIELLVAMTVLAVIVAVAVPMMSDDSALRMQAGSSILMSDLEFAQVYSISYPSDPISVRFVPEENSYWLAYTDAPETPMTRPDTGDPYLVKFGEGRASSATGLSLAVANMTNNTITFNAQGGLTRFDVTPLIIIGPAQGSSSRVLHLEISPMTGSISESFAVVEE